MDASQMSRSHPPVPLRLEASSETHGLKGGEEEPPELVTEEPAQMKSGLPADPPSDEGGGGGDGLPSDVQGQMESALGADFSGVKVHTDSSKAGELGALAFTQGEEVHFAPGQFDPGTTEGQSIIGHELAHVVQQREGRVTATGSEAGMKVNTDAGLEAEADALGAQAAQMKVAGEPVIKSGLAASYNAPVQKAADPCAPQLEEFKGEEIGLPGKISSDAANYEEAVATGMKIRAQPLPGLPEIGRMHYGMEVQVKARNYSGGWVFVMARTGVAGWIREDFVAMGMPDPESRLHHITETDLTTIMNRHYIETGLWDLETGNDFTTLASAIAIANAGRAGITVNADKMEKYYDEHKLKTTFDPWMAENFARYHAVEILTGHNIWLPSPAYVRTLQDSGVIGSRPGWLNTAIDIGKTIIGFTSGFYAGIYGSIWDMLVGLWDMGGMIIDFIGSVITGEIFSDIKAIYDEINREGLANVVEELWNALSTAVVEMAGDFADSWTHPNMFERWFFRGKVIGAVTLEVVLAIFTLGQGNAAIWIGRIAKVSPRLARLLMKALSKADDAITKKLRGGRRAVDDAEDVVDHATDGNAVKRRQAQAMASMITGFHEKRGSDIPTLMLGLEAVERTFKVVKGHGAEYKGPGKYRIVQFSRRRTIDETYHIGGEENREPERDGEGRDVIHEEPGGRGGWNKNLNSELKPNSVYNVGGYIYETDELGRVKRASGELRLKKRKRNKHQQTSSVKKKDGVEGDEGGHIFASIFDGPGEQINYWPQAGSTVNRGQWRSMENYCKSKLKETPPKKVEVAFEAIYEGDSKRPVGFRAVVKSDEVKRFNIPNE